MQLDELEHSSTLYPPVCSWCNPSYFCSFSTSITSNSEVFSLVLGWFSTILRPRQCLRSSDDHLNLSATSPKQDTLSLAYSRPGTVSATTSPLITSLAARETVLRVGSVPSPPSSRDSCDLARRVVVASRPTCAIFHHGDTGCSSGRAAAALGTSLAPRPAQPPPSAAAHRPPLPPRRPAATDYRPATAPPTATEHARHSAVDSTFPMLHRLSTRPMTMMLSCYAAMQPGLKI